MPGLCCGEGLCGGAPRPSGEALACTALPAPRSSAGRTADAAASALERARAAGSLHAGSSPAAQPSQQPIRAAELGGLQPAARIRASPGLLASPLLPPPPPPPADSPAPARPSCRSACTPFWRWLMTAWRSP